MNDDAQWAVKFCFLRDNGVYFCTIKYLNTSGQYLNTGMVFGI